MSTPRAKEHANHTAVELSEAQRLGRVGSWTLDIEAQRATASEEFYRILGVPRERISLASEFDRFIHVDDRGDVRRRFEDALLAQNTFATSELRTFAPTALSDRSFCAQRPRGR